MAARLREDMEGCGGTSAQIAETGYTLQNLKVAGVYAAECKERLDNQGMFWSDNEQRLGLDLAVQGMKTDYLTKRGNLSKTMQNLLQDSFQNYKNNYVDLLKQILKEKAVHFNTPMKTSIDQEEVSAVYAYTMNQYRQSGDILDAFMRGAKHAQFIFESKFFDRAGSPGSYEVVSKFHKNSGNGQHNDLFAKAASQNSDRVAYSKYMGSVTHTKEEKQQYGNALSGLFEQLKRNPSDQADIWSKIQNTMFNYAANRGGSGAIREQVLAGAGDSFTRIENCWSLLLKNE